MKTEVACCSVVTEGAVILVQMIVTHMCTCTIQTDINLRFNQMEKFSFDISHMYSVNP